MVSMCITDLENPDHVDRTRSADLWVVSNLWTERPREGERTVLRVLPGYAVHPDDTLLDSGPERALGEIARANLWDMIGQQRQWVYHRTDGDCIRAVNLTDFDMAREWARAIREHTAQLDGYLLDYCTSFDPAWSGWHQRSPMAGIPANFGPRFLPRWDRGLGLLEIALRPPDGARPFIVLGQQFHFTNAQALAGVNGLYFEQSPWRWGLGCPGIKVQIDLLAQAKRLGTYPPLHVVELRNPELYSIEELDEVRALCETTGAYLSLGRDKTAVGRIAA